MNQEEQNQIRFFTEQYRYLSKSLSEIEEKREELEKMLSEVLQKTEQINKEEREFLRILKEKYPKLTLNDILQITLDYAN